MFLNKDPWPLNKHIPFKNPVYKHAPHLPRKSFRWRNKIRGAQLTSCDKGCVKFHQIPLNYLRGVSDYSTERNIPWQITDMVVYNFASGHEYFFSLSKYFEIFYAFNVVELASHNTKERNKKFLRGRNIETHFKSGTMYTTMMVFSHCISLSVLYNMVPHDWPMKKFMFCIRNERRPNMI